MPKCVQRALYLPHSYKPLNCHIKFSNYQNKKHNSQVSFKKMDRELRWIAMKAHNPLTYQKVEAKIPNSECHPVFYKPDKLSLKSDS